tara:strand:- start:215 stop:880 length:666 start_codon:yes stop_codon:yes gene_type:complete
MTDNNSIPNPAFTHSSETDFDGVEVKKEEPKVEVEIPGSPSSTSSFGKYTFATLAIGKSTNRYIAIFKKITQGRFIIPSVPAGIFGLAWLIYRRVSVYGFMVYLMLVTLAYEFITKIDAISKNIQIALIFAFTHVVFYFIGNFLYWYSVRKKITKYRSKYGDTSAMTYLSQKGGVITGLNLLTVILLLQGGTFLTVYSLIYVDDFMVNLWSSFLQLVHLKG